MDANETIENPPPDDPLSRFSLSIFRVNGLLMRIGDIVTSAIGQSSARWQVLGRVGYKPHTVAEMARDMGHARQSVQRIANVLVSEGLAIYKENPADKRAQLVEITSQGSEVLSAIYALNEAWTEKLITKLSEAQLDALADDLEEISDILETEMRENPIGKADDA
jgi:DNA-binding MarR family transcriptional regulator